MNGAIYDSTFNVFFKLKYAKTYDAILSTPVGVGDVALGEIGWALIRGGIYAAAFLVVMVALGMVLSPWAVLAFPAALLVGFAFGAAGMAATSFMRTWQDFDLVQLVILPLFLFSATFYPITTYPEPIQALVQLTPLYHGVDLIRGLTTGAVARRSWSTSPTSRRWVSSAWRSPRAASASCCSSRRAARGSAALSCRP